MSLGFIVGTIRYLIIEVIPVNRKSEIFTEALKMYKGKMDSNGRPELIIGQRKVILDYGNPPPNGRVFEYVIAYIDISDVESNILKLCNQKFDTEEIYNKTYVKYNCHWNYEGYTFSDRIEKKVAELNEYINELTFANIK